MNVYKLSPRHKEHVAIALQRRNIRADRRRAQAPRHSMFMAREVIPLPSPNDPLVFYRNSMEG